MLTVQHAEVWNKVLDERYPASITYLCYKYMITTFRGYYICTISANMHRISEFSYSQLLVSASSQKIPFWSVLTPKWRTDAATDRLTMPCICLTPTAWDSTAQLDSHVTVLLWFSGDKSCGKNTCTFLVSPLFKVQSEQSDTKRWSISTELTSKVIILNRKDNHPL